MPEQTSYEQAAPAVTAAPQTAAPLDQGPPQPSPVQNTPEGAIEAQAMPAAGGPALPPDAAGETAPPPVDAAAAAATTVANAPAAATAPEVQQEVAEDTPAPESESENGIILNIRRNSWVEIRGKDGKSVVSRVLKAGDRYFVPDRPDLTISLGNAGGVELEVQGQKLKPLGRESEVKRNIPLDASYLKKNYGQ